MAMNLTKAIWAALIGTFVIAALVVSYSNFAVLNGANIDARYMNALQNISAQYSSFSGNADVIGNPTSAQSILDFGRNLITGTVNVFVVGLQSMGAFFNMIPIVKVVFSAVTLGIPELTGLLGLMTVIMGVWFAMQYIKSVSNKFELP